METQRQESRQGPGRQEKHVRHRRTSGTSNITCVLVYEMLSISLEVGPKHNSKRLLVKSTECR